MKLIGQGRTAEIYHYADDLILKLYRTGFSGEAVQNEYRISQWVYEKRLPVPRAVKQMHHATRMGIVFERFEGTTLLAPKFDPGALYRALRRSFRDHS